MQKFLTVCIRIVAQKYFASSVIINYISNKFKYLGTRKIENWRTYQQFRIRCVFLVGNSVYEARSMQPLSGLHTLRHLAQSFRTAQSFPAQKCYIPGNGKWHLSAAAGNESPFHPHTPPLSTPSGACAYWSLHSVRKEFKLPASVV